MVYRRKRKRKYNKRGKKRNNKYYKSFKKHLKKYRYNYFLLLLLAIFLILWFTTNVFGNNPEFKLKNVIKEENPENTELMNKKQKILKVPRNFGRTFGKNDLNYSSLDENDLSGFSSIFSSNFSNMKNNLVINQNKKHPLYKSELLKTNIPIVKNCSFSVYDLDLDYKKPIKRKIFASNYDDTEYNDYLNIGMFLI